MGKKLDGSYLGLYFLRHGYRGHPFRTKLNTGVQRAPRLDIPKFQNFLKNSDICFNAILI